MTERSSSFFRAVAALIFTLTAAGAFADARKPAPASPGIPVLSFFRFAEWIPPPLRNGLRDYEEGRFFAALGNADALLAAGGPRYAIDDARFLRALALVALGWDDAAVPALRSVLDPDPGPYWVPSLLELVEIHDRAGRWKAVADVWERYVDRPLRTGGGRGERIADLLSEFGELRPPIPGSTRREKSLLSKPEELAVLLEKRRERASDRIVYRAGLALLRLGRHEDSLRTFYMIGVKSPYYPYGRFSIVQNLLALERSDDARKALMRLKRYPKITPEERALGSRAILLEAALRMSTGDLDRGIRIAQSIDDDDPEASAARLLVSTALLEAEKPALAITYDTATEPPTVEAEASRALAIGAAYASLGDMEAAAKVFGGAVKNLRAARTEASGRGEVVERLRGLVEDFARERRAHERSLREVTAGGMRIVLAHDGPWSFGTLVRRVRAALGAGAYRELARGTKPRPAKALSAGDPWLAYLTSSRRARIERLVDRLADIRAEERRSGPEASLRVLNAYLVWLEEAPSEGGARDEVRERASEFAERLRSETELDVSPLAFEPGISPPAAVAAFRRWLSEAAAAAVGSKADVDGVDAARDDASERLGGRIEQEIREVLKAREAELRNLEFDLDTALAGTLVRQTQPPGENSPGENPPP